MWNLNKSHEAGVKTLGKRTAQQPLQQDTSGQPGEWSSACGEQFYSYRTAAVNDTDCSNAVLFVAAGELVRAVTAILFNSILSLLKKRRNLLLWVILQRCIPIHSHSVVPLMNAKK